MEALYQRDIVRMGGSTEGTSDEDYKKFMAEIGMPETDASGRRSDTKPGPASRQGLGFDSGRYFHVSI